MRVAKVAEPRETQTNRPATLSTRPERRFWGWGYVHDAIAEDELRRVHRLLAWLGGAGPALTEPRTEDFQFAAPRVAAPSTLATVLSSSPYDRLTHCCGKSFPDGARLWMREVAHAPDWVAFPRNDAEIIDVLDWASRNNIAVIPFGGGTSVAGGVEPAVGEKA